MQYRIYIQYTYPYEYLGIPQAETTVFFLRASSHMGRLLHSELRGESWPRLESDSAALAAAILCDADMCVPVRSFVLNLKQTRAPIPTVTASVNPITKPISIPHAIATASISWLKTAAREFLSQSIRHKEGKIVLPLFHFLYQKKFLFILWG